ncbi:malonyl-coenzyme A:anthocyanin 3-O-glucoside-6''-O-malonyltransferase-like [Macadamia integrifolia]|uniref:malonyl-coenzyme A:anthocyanin 3-O-glucoside-6''-O-malonyltransferase-like n=1 Tax=Macadamia integrifolia TaxID=60698 RepID=UPI001C4E9FB1|nr:malonyl-coenzyme A:anthocyanin 3-O-glucoside-6''-O-malonyltransferase-like [Macadamia integrifolia]
MESVHTSKNMAHTNPVKLLEHCNISSPPGCLGNKILPLTFFDMFWLPPYPLVEALFFYDYSYSMHHFRSAIFPNLKHSLSLTLQYFYPLAGHLVWPQNLSEPEFCYVDGDSVSLTLAESDGDFYHLSGNHARDVNQFHCLVPKLTLSSIVDPNFSIPLLALQVTVFPNSGICIGVTASHVALDARTLVHFMKSWATISRSGVVSLSPVSLPFLDRNVINDQKELKTIYLNEIKKIRGTIEQKSSKVSNNPMVPSDMVQATFVMNQNDVEQLRQWILAIRKKDENQTSITTSHLSTYTIICAHTWVCSIKSRSIDGPAAKSEDTEIFLIAMDCRIRDRLDPPVPETYFGNCLTGCVATVKRSDLLGEHGISIASEAITKAIKKRLDDGVLKGADYLMSEMSAAVAKEPFAVAGSPKYRIYDTDFGWGRPKKYESLRVGGRLISLYDCKDGEGSVEVGVAFPKFQMDSFSSLFYKFQANVS